MRWRRAEPPPMGRLLAAALFAASALLAVPASAIAQVSVPQLAPGEVLLETDGVGRVETPASRATVTSVVSGSGATAEEARRNLEAEIRRVREAARTFGASDADISTGPAGESLYALMIAVEARGEPGDEIVTRRVTIRLRDAPRAQELHSLLNSSNELAAYRGPVYELDDEAGPRREARRLALAAARADAEAYADAVGMRILRMVRITERAGFGFGGLFITEPMMDQNWGWAVPRSPRGTEVETMAVVGVDFVLAPR